MESKTVEINPLYNKEIVCTVCETKFTTSKVRSRSLRLNMKDTDLHAIYEGNIDPIHYLVWVCPQCGYSSTESEFQNLHNTDKAKLFNIVASKWKPRSLGGKRTVQQAEESYLLALVVGQILGRSKVYMGMLSLRLAWIYRQQNNQREKEFLEKALKLFKDSFQNEKPTENQINEYTLMYLIGELSRRLGDYKTAIKWYNKALEHNDMKKNRPLQLMAREQWTIAREQYKAESNVDTKQGVV